MYINMYMTQSHIVVRALYHLDSSVNVVCRSTMIYPDNASGEAKSLRYVAMVWRNKMILVHHIAPIRYRGMRLFSQSKFSGNTFRVDSHQVSRCKQLVGGFTPWKGKNWPHWGLSSQLGEIRRWNHKPGLFQSLTTVWTEHLKIYFEIFSYHDVRLFQVLS